MFLSEKGNNKKGFSLVEVLLASSIFVLVVTGLVGAVIYIQQSARINGERTRALLLLNGAMEAVRSIKADSWNEIVFSETGLDNSSGVWELLGEGSSESIDKFSRELQFVDVCRNSSDQIVGCPGDYTDVNTKQVIVTVSWESRPGFFSTVQDSMYITNWTTSDWEQTDWSGGSGQSVWADETSYSSDDGNIDVSTAGQVKLKAISSGCSDYTWAFDTPANYSYDTGKIEVTSSLAQLLPQSGNVTGSTTDPGFDTGSPWSSGDWDYSSQDYVTNNRSSSLGNPSWWAYNYLRLRDNQSVGGYWEQAFTVTEDNPDSVTIDLDYMVYYNTMQMAYDVGGFYVFIDTFSGEPSSTGDAVWSYMVNGSEPTQSWFNASGIDVTSEITSAGTYYLKIGVYLDTGNGPGNNYRYLIGGWDNVELNWSKATSSYPIDRPTINPVSAYTPSNLGAWSAFSETATKNGGEIYYQISDDGGTTWYYWDGVNWSTAGANDYNIASDISDNLWYFDASNGEIMFKAFLESDGSQLVQLDEVSVSCLSNGLKMEAGTVSTDENWVTVSLQNQYVDPIVVTSYYESANTYPASTRIDNIAIDSFDVKLQSPSGFNLSVDEITYFVIERGMWQIDSVKVEADRYDTNTVGSKGSWSYDNVSFNQSFSTDPIVLHQVMSNNDSNWIATYVSRDNSQNNPPDTDGMRIALNGAEATSSHGTETIGWIAIEMNQTGSFSGTDFETYRTSDSVQGHNNGCYNFNYQNSYSSAPVVLVTQLEMDGGDGGWSVKCNESQTQVGMHSEEDIVGDTDRNHTGETFGFIAFSDLFDYAEGIGSGYVTDGTLTSSAFDTGKSSNFVSIGWEDNIPSCTPACEVLFQVRSAVDSGGSPGTWTDWLGSSGIGTYFSINEGEIIPIDLNDNQWVQYRFILTGDGVDSPILEAIRIKYK